MTSPANVSAPAAAPASAPAHPSTIGPYPYFPIEFDKNGALANPAQLAAVMQALTAPAIPAAPITDLFVASHGWNNDIPEAEELYGKIFGAVGNVLAQRTPASDALRARNVALLGVLWPSKRFEDSDLTPGGSAALTDDGASLKTTIDALASFIDSSDASASLARATALVPRLADSLDARDEFVRIVRAFMPHGANDEEPVIADDFYTLNGDELLQRLARPGRGDSTSGGAAGLGDWLGKAVDGAKSLANLVLYYQMKNRAGVIGQTGVCDMLHRIRAERPASGDNALRLHFVGHSFGCRLLTAAVAGPTADSTPLPVTSMSLLQAAFSHYGFAQAYDGTHDGYYRRDVVDPVRVTGPLLITFTAKDKAVGLAYPIASRIARQIASAIGDANDPYGGLGRNGAQKTPGSQTITLAAPGAAYTFQSRGIYNLDSNAVIAGHSDLGHDEVGWALVSAAASK